HRGRVTVRASIRTTTQWVSALFYGLGGPGGLDLPPRLVTLQAPGPIGHEEHTRGRRGGKDQARQGHEVDGGGRWRRRSAGMPPGLGQQAEVTLLERTLDHVDVLPADEGADDPQPRRLICAKGYDSDPLRDRLQMDRDIELVCPHRKSRTR